MAKSTRTSLSERRERDVRGTDVLFGTPPATVGAEVEAAPVEVAPAPKAALSKVTLYIRPDQVLSIEKIQLDQRQKTGAKPDKSDLVQEALDLLTAKYGIE